MIHMGVRDDNVTHLPTLLGSEPDSDASGINRNAIVDQIACQPLLQSRVATAIKGAM